MLLAVFLVGEGRKTTKTADYKELLSDLASMKEELFQIFLHPSSAVYIHTYIGSVQL